MTARLILLIAIGTLISACSRDKQVRCSTGTFYQEAQSAGLLRVPDDLSVPPATEALQIPPEGPPREIDENSAACLEFSPAMLAEE